MTAADWMLGTNMKEKNHIILPRARNTFLAFRLVSLLQIKENRKLKFALPMVYYVDDV